MTGLSVITDQEGKPKIITIDVEQHDPQLDLIVTALLDLLQQQSDDDEPDYSDVPAYTTRTPS